MFLVKYCRDCGVPHETGSLIWYECPVTGKWKSACDVCDVHNAKV